MMQYIIYKNGNKKEQPNYKPVSLTSIVCKVIESIIRDFIMKHFLTNGFLVINIMVSLNKGRSTVLQLLQYLMTELYNT